MSKKVFKIKEKFIYFSIRFGLVNGFNTYLRLKICACISSSKCKPIEFANPTFNTSFLVKNKYLNFCVHDAKSKLELNVKNKDLWYTK